MKADLIADWRARVADRTLITLPVTAIERILDERERLLAALLEIASADHAEDGGPECNHPEIADTAIAYAEAE